MKFKSKRSDELQFINKSLTNKNPKDLYYLNIEELIKKYFITLLVGLIMLGYLIIY